MNKENGPLQNNMKGIFAPENYKDTKTGHINPYHPKVKSHKKLMK